MRRCLFCRAVVYEFTPLYDSSNSFIKSSIGFFDNWQLVAATVVSFVLAFLAAIGGCVPVAHRARSQSRLTGDVPARSLIILLYLARNIARAMYYEQTIAQAAKQLKDKFAAQGNSGRVRKDRNKADKDEVKISLPHPYRLPSIAYNAYK